MDEETLTDTLIEEALQAYPLAPLPDQFTEQLMAHVQTRALISPPIRFRLDVLDFAIPGIVALVGIIVLALTGIFPLPQLPITWDISAWTQLTAVPMTVTAVIIFIIFAEISLGAATCFWIWEKS